jgi:ABC-type transport system involved in cytochrome bd biosynthesis fused ATPase/permease subunit
LWDNIVVGNEEADTTYVSRLTQAVGLADYIGGLKEGYDTVLDPTGNRLPKNVVNKILLVRALAHKPNLLLLEEPWQGLDDTAKQQVLYLLLNEVNATVLIATNDPDFVKEADQVVSI